MALKLRNHGQENFTQCPIINYSLNRSKIMKSSVFGFGIAGSLVLGFAINSEANAHTFSGIPPIPPELMEYIHMAEAGTLPNPLLDPSITTNWVAGGRVSYINPVANNGGQFSLFQVFVPPDNGPPVHFHTRETEWFYVLEGNPLLQMGENLSAMEPGDLMFSPVGQLHSYKNFTSDPVQMLLFYEPQPGDDPTAIGNIERFFSDPRVATAVNPDDPNERPASYNPAELLDAGPDYGLFFPSTFTLPQREYTGNQVTILRTGVADEAASVVLGLSNGMDIYADFDMGEFLQTITLPPEVGDQKLDLILKNPSPNSGVSLVEAKAVRQCR
jgi:mannose-6-phosphate isomerase-like protein (cupin superfamily)